MQEFHETAPKSFRNQAQVHDRAVPISIDVLFQALNQRPVDAELFAPEPQVLEGTAEGFRSSGVGEIDERKTKVELRLQLHLRAWMQRSATSIQDATRIQRIEIGLNINLVTRQVAGM